VVLIKIIKVCEVRNPWENDAGRCLLFLGEIGMF